MASSSVRITGALSGIGRATAIAYARQGARLAISGRRVVEGEALAAELTALGAEALFAQALARFGRLEIVVNNAGTAGHSGPSTEVTAEDDRDAFETNVLGTLLTATAMLDRLKGSQERLAARPLPDRSRRQAAAIHRSHHQSAKGDFPCRH